MKGTLTPGEPVKRTTAVLTLQIKSFVKLSLATKNMFSISCTEIAAKFAAIALTVPALSACIVVDDFPLLST